MRARGMRPRAVYSILSGAPLAHFDQVAEHLWFYEALAVHGATDTRLAWVISAR